jgi:2-dehydro-3-deoxyphosphogluconate aldolase/(4S)-4-hydroxy-2-oxoglutarate aldolase
MLASPPTNPAIPEAILSGRVIAIARRIRPARAPAIAEALVRGGVRAIEITLNEPEAEALSAIEALASRAVDLGALVGAGTILSIESAERALTAGARFLVSPHDDPELVTWAAARGVPVFPGAFSPTEIVAAWRAGASAVKLFPAVVLGPDFLVQLRGPLPGIPIVPTGGVRLETAADWLRAGAVALGMGGWLIGEGDPDAVADRARRLRVVIDESTGGAA